MISRRKFLQTTTVAAAGTYLLPACQISKSPKNVGLQLYTLRDAMAEDPVGVIKKVAEMGYTRLEGYTTQKGFFFGISPNELSALLKDLNVKLVSTHGLSARKSFLNNPNAETDLRTLVNDAKTIGCRYLVCPWMNANEYQTLDDIKLLADFFNEKGEVLAKEGLKFAYHNHAFEFETVVEGQTVQDHLLTLCNPEWVDFELDLYWITKAGKSATEYFEKYPGRFTLWHVKDMNPTNKDLNTEIGNGTIDFKSIFAVADKAGLKYSFVEQETYEMEPLQSAKVSCDYLSQQNWYK